MATETRATMTLITVARRFLDGEGELRMLMSREELIERLVEELERLVGVE